MMNNIRLIITILNVSFFTILLIVGIYFYHQNNELKSRIKLYERFNASDTSQILNLIIRKELSLGRLTDGLNDKIYIQLYPYIFKRYSIIEFNDKIVYSDQIYRFECPDNYFNFLTFDLTLDSTAIVEYILKNNKATVRLRKDPAWRIDIFAIAY